MREKQKNVAEEEICILPVETLHLRMAREFCDLANICSKVEMAVGDMIGRPKKQLDEPIITLQGLDRLRQSLEDMARLSTILSQFKAAPTDGANLAKEIKGTLVLSGLVERLIHSYPLTEFANEAGHEEYWD